MPRLCVRPPKQSKAFRQSATKPFREDASNYSERGLPRLILVGNLSPCESRDYTIARSSDAVNALSTISGLPFARLTIDLVPDNRLQFRSISRRLSNFPLSPHQIMSLYATRSESRVYHLVEGRESYTVCGLRVTRHKIALPTKGGLLRLVSEKPENRELCKHCLRLSEKESQRRER